MGTLEVRMNTLDDTVRGVEGRISALEIGIHSLKQNITEEFRRMDDKFEKRMQNMGKKFEKRMIGFEKSLEENMKNMEKNMEKKIDRLTTLIESKFQGSD
mmetsp:Transcript_12263/g.12299  ORF Transcript_12263/g.12299 Transcript_12263/m.12299 type:complete len:100 (-) Transcript_12263:42-341(-)